MKIYYILLGMIILAGCGKKAESLEKAQVQGAKTKVMGPKHCYPALNESALPPPPPSEYYASSGITTSGRINTVKATQSRVIIKSNIGLESEIEKMELIKQLRKYSAEKGTNSPFSLTEEKIEAIYNLDNPILN